MSIVLVADVFGKTPALVQLSEALNGAVIVDPYDGKDMGFANEAEAYAYFRAEIGFEVYLAKLKKTLGSSQAVTTIIGFSVGASLVWKLSEAVGRDSVKRAICFYGSQIRNLTEVVPKIDVELIFPKSEPHFNVSELITRLSKTPKVTATQVDYLHGFMNVYSDNFNKQAYNEQLELLCGSTHENS